MGVGAHATLTDRMQVGDLRHWTALRIKQLLRLVRHHPFLQFLQMQRVLPGVGERHLMAAPIALDTFAVDLLGASPSLGRAENDHWPGWPARSTALAIIALYLGNAVQARVERGGELLMHSGRVITLNDIRLVAVSPHQIQQLIGRYAGQNGGIGNLVPVEMQDRQHRSISDWVQELVGVPRGRKRASLGFAVADDASNDQVWVVKGCPVRVRDRVAEFAALMDGPRSLRSHVARDSTGKRELRKEPLHAPSIAGDVGIDLRVSALQPG